MGVRSNLGDGLRPHRQRSRRRLSRGDGLPAVLAAGLLLGLLTTASPASGRDVGELELTAPVLQNLKRLHDAWDEWKRAYYQDNSEEAAAALQQLQAIGQFLGAAHLPDHAVAMAAFAGQSAAEGNVERTRWVVDAARQLDPGRPEVEFASARGAWAAEDFFGAMASVVRGYAKTWRLPIEGRILRQNIGVWAVYLLIVAGGFFVVLQMAVRGTGLHYDLGRLVSPPLPRGVGDLAAGALLIWPVFLPSGVLWLALYWSILIWGYGARSEKGVLATLWLLVGLTPLAVAHQQREVQQALMPSTRVIENLRSDRLYGALVLDLDVLRRLVPDSPVVTELIGDLHRNFKQWEHARLIYSGLIEGQVAGGNPAPALNNLGVYHHQAADYGTAIEYFKEASASDPRSAEAFFNLSQAYNQIFNFPEAHQALASAKQIDSARVDIWLGSEGGSEGNVVAIEGGLARLPEVIAALDLAGRDSLGSGHATWRRYLSLAAAIAAFALAVTLHRMRKQKGYPSAKFSGHALVHNRWLQALVPGWSSTVARDGHKALFSILLPAGLLLAVEIGKWGYRVPVAQDPVPDLLRALAWTALAVWLVVRVSSALRSRS